MECLYGRNIGNTVNPGGSEMTLESNNICRQRFIKNTINFRSITVKSQHRLQCLDRLTPVAELQKTAAGRGGGFDPVPHPRVKK